MPVTRKQKTYRDLGAMDLVLEFAKITRSTNINRGRDGHFLKVYMEETASTGVEVLWQIYQFQGQNLPNTIPCFIRWARRQDIAMEPLQAELGVIEKVAGLKPPVDTLLFFDYAYGGVMNANEQREMESARERLDRFIESILSQPIVRPKMGV